MHLRHFAASILGLLLLARPALAALPPALEQALRATTLPSSAVSLLVRDVASPTPLVALNLEVPRNPASTVKLITTFVALDALGPLHRWSTEVYLLGPLNDGVLQGDLLLRGRGDPYLIEQELWRFAGELRRLGLREITGRLLIDDSYFAPAPRTADAFDNQPLRLYNVPPNAAMVNFKAFTFHFAPAKNGRDVTITADPALPNLIIDNQLHQSTGPCHGILAHVKMAVLDPVIANPVVFSGDYPHACGEQTLPRTALTPEAYTYGLFKNLWAQWGGTLAGGVARGLRPVGQKPYYVGYSAPLAEVIRPLNKWSNNVMADALLYALADRAHAPPLQPQDGVREIERWLTEQGISTQGLVMENGSGLSRQTRVTASTLGGLLGHAWTSPWMPEYLASLALVGMDGTARKHFRHAPETGRMHLKTGHLDNVAAVAGYVLARSGHTYVVTLLMNHPTVNQGGGNAFMDAVLKWTFQH